MRRPEVFGALDLLTPDAEEQSAFAQFRPEVDSYRRGEQQAAASARFSGRQRIAERDQARCTLGNRHT
jgi:hypothetical protein